MQSNLFTDQQLFLKRKDIVEHEKNSLWGEKFSCQNITFITFRSFNNYMNFVNLNKSVKRWFL
ncbi:hypothetical protein AKJ61_02190 [candidate division MSBL1 archaeon SCGC-AAA259B11]|uniref:Uncharacterized protein n=1 Tax=candidate division MSBL1 archaeon SCGC-AAA259B11 TaxID=1698260 RepID=A0A133U6F9_9EURY|nr:hypothetical protein AKJ61_02190 [candidate division MSBL1 archaeon SCGC-AAA259B11]